MSTQRQLLLFAVGCLTVACVQGTPFLLEGDPNSAQVGFTTDLDGATAVARRHCAQFERVPRFVEAEENVAYFDCVPR